MIDNSLKANATKCHFLFSSNKSMSIKSKNSSIESSKSEKCLDENIDSNL